LRTIQLTRGLVAIVDDEDFEWISKFRWYASAPSKSGCVYAVRTARVPGLKNPRTFKMHREIVGAVEGYDVDHANGNTLDNTRGNLRVASKRDNMRNKRKMRGSYSSRFTGVSRDVDCKRWLARIGGRDGEITLGRFLTEEEAARAYDAKARELYGEFARLNFPE